MDLTTVADDEVVFHDGLEVRRYPGLEPDTAYELEGRQVRTLPRPGGELLTSFCTANDVHFGELECGHLDGFDEGPIYMSEPDAEPYPTLMNRCAVAEMTEVDPAAVVVKGDLTAFGTLDEYEQFLAVYEPAFGDRLHHVRGNHDAYYGETFADTAPYAVELPGVTLAVIDTAIPRRESGRVSAESLEWLDQLAAEADRPVLVFGHHHAWSPDSADRPEGYFGINPDDSERLVELVARRPGILGYFAGHTHRNRVRRFTATGSLPWVEVAAVKDFPGGWAEYRVFEGGILQVFRRVSVPEALAWSEKTRDMYGGLYEGYALGALGDRCFPMEPRS
ncbi:MAG TPA: metallophosphoesterase [Acidimicrobiales bacterium]|nr:metallophosphoesterase [Acidimicrobiales bacterium]